MGHSKEGHFTEPSTRSIRNNSKTLLIYRVALSNSLFCLIKNATFKFKI